MRSTAGDINALPDKIPSDLYAYELQSEWEKQALEKLQQAPVSEEPPPPPSPSDTKAATTTANGHTAGNGIDVNGLSGFISIAPEALQAAKGSKKKKQQQKQATDTSTAQPGTYDQSTYGHEGYGYGCAQHPGPSTYWQYGTHGYGNGYQYPSTYSTDAHGSAQSWQQYWEYCTAYYQQYGQYPAELYSLYEQYGNAPQSQPVPGRSIQPTTTVSRDAPHRDEDESDDESEDDDYDTRHDEGARSGSSEQNTSGMGDYHHHKTKPTVANDSSDEDSDDEGGSDDGNYENDSSYANDDYLDLLAGDEALDEHAAQLIQGITFQFPPADDTTQNEKSKHQQATLAVPVSSSTAQPDVKGQWEQKAGSTSAQKAQTGTQKPVSNAYQVPAGSPGQSVYSHTTYLYPAGLYPAYDTQHASAHGQGYYGQGNQYGNVHTHQSHATASHQTQPDYSHLHPGVAYSNQQQYASAYRPVGYQPAPAIHTSSAAYLQHGLHNPYLMGTASSHVNPYQGMCTACAMQQYTKQYNAWLERYTAWYNAFTSWQKQSQQTDAS